MLVNNAGMFEAAPIDSADWTAQWERTLRINLIAAAELCRLAVLHFRERGGGGRIVNVASRAAYRGDSPDHWHYAASKAGHGGDDQDDRPRLCGEGIYAFAVCPGFTVTGMVEDYIESRGGLASLGELPLGRPATTDEIAETVRWLARRRAALGDRRGDRRQRRQLCPLDILLVIARRKRAAIQCWIAAIAPLLAMTSGSGGACPIAGKSPCPAPGRRPRR